MSFSDLVARFYRDKRLRQAFLHAIEDIELTLDTKISHILGRKYGAFGYTNFFNWCQKFESNPYISHKENGKRVRGTFMSRSMIRKEQRKFISNSLDKKNKSSSPDMKSFRDTNDENSPAPIWLLVNELTLGESIHIIKLMSKENRKEIAAFFHTKIETLIRWLECINLIRNICCHNGDLADIRLITTPPVPNSCKKYLLSYPGRGYTNRLALPLSVILNLINTVNEKYQVDPIFRSLNNLMGDTNAKYYGFRSNKKFHEFCKAYTQKRKKKRSISNKHFYQTY